MKKITFVLLLIALVITPQSRAECVEEEGDGDFKKFFKKIGCNIQEGAEKIAEKSKPYVDSIRNETSKLADKAKPYVDSIGNQASKLADSAKQLGSDAADKWNEYRGKVHAANNDTVLSDEVARDNFAFPTEENTVSSSTAATPSSNLPTPSSVDDRFLLDGEKHCPEGTKSIGEGRPCRKIIDS